MATIVTGGERLEELTRVVAELERWGYERSWTGSDPYEGLNAERGRFLKRSALGRRLLIQLVKRSPLDLRSVLGITPAHNPAALAHVVSAYARPCLMPDPDGRRRLEWALGLLIGSRSPGHTRPCWGYPFDVESRTIASSFAGLALLDAHERLGEREQLELAVGTGEFLLHEVKLTRSGGGGYFGYFPGDATPIHNANLLACGLLARLAELTDRRDFLDAARLGSAFALAHQRPDGSWPYGERGNLEWVDNFHTGYVLDSLLRCARALADEELLGAYMRGLRYYTETMFLPDGTPKYRPDSVYPIDSQCVAQAITTFALAEPVKPGSLEWAWRSFGFAVERMLRGDGAFVFQRRRLWSNRTPHVRWVEAPMFDALTRLRVAATTGASR
jgi:hypothetical protein